MPRKATSAQSAAHGQEKVPVSLPDLECACASVRRAARLVTQVYGHEMGSGIEPGQFSLLMMMKRRPGWSQGAMGRVLGFDKTTLSRNLRVMKRNGWIEEMRAEEDARERTYRLTAAGEKAFAAALPGWQRAQATLRSAMADGEWERALATFGRVARVAQELREGGR